MAENATIVTQGSAEEHASSSYSRKLVIGGIIVALALGYFAFKVFTDSTLFYYTVSELKAEGVSLYGETVRVNGKLVPDSFRREEGSAVARFALADQQEQLSATYQGVVPDLFFNPYSEIILQGVYDPQGVFKVDTIMVKCPSKYQSLASQEQKG